jgi:ketosteroid isomerase-like protein
MSAADLAHFASGLHTARFLPAAALRAAWTPARLADGRPVAVRLNTDADTYGFGWFITSLEGRRLLTHGGGITGYSANLYHFPDETLTVAVLANVKARDDGAAPVDPLARRIAAACLAHRSCRPDPGRRAMQDTIRLANRRFSEAYVRGDTAAIRRLYIDDPVALPPDGRAVTGSGPVARLFAARGDGHLGHTLYTERLDLHGDAMVETGTWFDVWRRDGGVRASSGRYVLTWVRERGVWKIAADSWSAGLLR